jgi:hypothetical protein
MLAFSFYYLFLFFSYFSNLKIKLIIDWVLFYFFNPINFQKLNYPQILKILPILLNRMFKIFVFIPCLFNLFLQINFNILFYFLLFTVIIQRIIWIKFCFYS